MITPVFIFSMFYYFYILTIYLHSTLERGPTLHHFTWKPLFFCLVLDGCCSALFNSFDSYQPVCVLFKMESDQRCVKAELIVELQCGPDFDPG